MNLVDFILESNNCKSTEDLVNSFYGFVSGFGIDRLMMADYSHDPVRVKNPAIMAVYPDEPREHFADCGYFNYGNDYHRILRAAAPFIWEDDPSEEAMRIPDRGEDLKLCCGVFVTLHQPMGQIIGISFAGSGKKVRCDRDALSLLHAASLHFLVVYSGLNMANPVNADVSFTDREREVLFWIARGKSKTDIGKILSVSESSIKRHCENIFIKLEVNNLPFAVAKALKMGIINPL